MDKEFTKEEIKKAIDQANANLEFEEVDLPVKEKEDSNKVLRKDYKSERYRRSKGME